MENRLNQTAALIIICLLYCAAALGQSWTTAGITVDGPIFSLYSDSNNMVFAGGRYTMANTLFAGNALGYSDNKIFQLGMPMGIDNSMLGTNADVLCWQRYNGKLYSGGMFTTAEGYNIKYITYLYAWEYYALGKVSDQIDGNVRCMAVYNGKLYIGGDFTKSNNMTLSHIASWNGKTWEALASGVNGTVRAMTVYKGSLVLGGDFDSAGSIRVNHIAFWNGSSFTSADNGLSSNSAMDSLHLKPSVYALAEYHNQLYAAGIFKSAGQTPVVNIALWDDNGWTDCGVLGSKNSDVVKCLSVYNDRLFAGGAFTYVTDGSLGLKPANYIAAWDGHSWEPLGNGTDNSVEALAEYNGGLIAAGYFSKAGGMSLPFIAQWREHNSAVNKENYTNYDVWIFPNPSKGQVKISVIKNERPWSYSIMNIIGQVIASGNNISGKEITADISLLPSGIYMIKVASGNAEKVMRLDIQE